MTFEYRKTFVNIPSHNFGFGDISSTIDRQKARGQVVVGLFCLLRRDSTVSGQIDHKGKT